MFSTFRPTLHRLYGKFNFKCIHAWVASNKDHYQNQSEQRKIVHIQVKLILLISNLLPKCKQSKLGFLSALALAVHPEINLALSSLDFTGYKSPS